MSHLLRLLLVSLLLVSFSCSPEGPASSENNTNNTNNLNNANNVNNFNNSNNLNNTNNVNNLNNLNNTNNTVGPQCGTSGGVCEWWQECSEQNVCVTAAGYCADGNDCGAYERCPASHMCERDDPASCGFTYHSDFPSPVSGALKMPGTLVPRSTEPLAGGEIDHGPWPS
ncbi:hypothetical protein KKF84_02860, partial [Myxococcota bacterium]|nr:hypothetical protein [Myxococcota bacterium]MBU1534230.1 hypothetical protein [Myxococcota bacterium]